MPNTVPETYLRRLDDQPVDALQYTGENLEAVRALVGGGFRAEAWPDRVVLTRGRPPARVAVGAWDWVLNDGERVYAGRSYDFWSHCRSVPIE